MSKPCDYVFVLWGNRFDEVAATIFITELRKIGQKVKVVGLSARRLDGAPDLAIEDLVRFARKLAGIL